jgi:antirestriction protein
MNTITTDTPRIYVSCLAAYSNGTLHGAWIDADQNADEIRAEVAEILKTSPNPNVILQDLVCDCGHEWTEQISSPNYSNVCPECDGKGNDDKPDYKSAEEWAIHDTDNFHGIKVEEWESFEKVAELAEILAEHGEAFAAFWNNSGSGEDVKKEDFEDAYRGRFVTFKEFAEELSDDMGDETKAHYFDYGGIDGFVNDLEHGGDYWTAPANPYGVHVFDNNA